MKGLLLQVDRNARRGQPSLTVIGEKGAIGPSRADLVSRYERWLNAIDVMASFADGPLTPLTREIAQARHERVTKTENDARFTIYERATLRPIGLTDLFEIDYFHRTAGFGILIGEKDCWGSGVRHRNDPTDARLEVHPPWLAPRATRHLSLQRARTSC